MFNRKPKHEDKHEHKNTAEKKHHKPTEHNEGDQVGSEGKARQTKHEAPAKQSDIIGGPSTSSGGGLGGAPTS